MARPRKNETETADGRLVSALWDLLEDNRLSSITVGMVTARAGLNRGTFYYHFASMDELVERAIEQEIIGGGAIMDNLLCMIAGRCAASSEKQMADRTHKIALLIERGGSDILSNQVKLLATRMWEAVLCSGDAQLTAETRFVIEYSTSGIIGIVAHDAAHGSVKTSPEFFASFVKSNSEFILARISEAQGVPRSEILDRVQTVIRMRGIL